MKRQDPWIWLDGDKYPDRVLSRYTGNWDNSSDSDTVVEFSRVYSFDKPISHIEIEYSADAIVQTWINGRFIGTGPVCVGGDFLANDRARANRYSSSLTILGCGDDDFISRRLVVGELDSGRVEFLARVRLFPVQICDFSVGRGGYMLHGTVYFTDGEREKIHTDNGWKCTLCPSYSLPGHYDGSLDRIDAGLAVSIPDVWNVERSPLPHRVERRLSGDGSIITLASGETRECAVRYEKIYAAYPSVICHADGRVEIEASYYETERDVAHKGESLVFNRDDEYIGTTMYGVGYIKLRLCNKSNSDATVDFSINEAYLPSSEEARITTDTDWMNKVLDVCRHTLKYCRQYIHLDSPKHCEPSACTGDYYIESMMSTFSFADMSLADFDVVRTARALEHNDGEMFHPTYSLIWVRMLLDVYMRCGRKGLLEESRAALDMLLSRFSGYVGELGIIDTPPNYMFVDWIVVDGFSLHHPPKALGQSVMNMFYYDALCAATEIYSYLGDTDSALATRVKADELRDAINTHLYDKERKMYYEGMNTPTPCEYLGYYMPQNTEKRYYRINANALAVAFGVISGEDAKELICRILDSDEYDDYQPYFAHFVLKAVHRANLDDRYLLKILNKWREPVAYCDMGLAEGFIPPEDGYIFDHSHAWGGTPLYSLPMAITSLRILEPGMDRLSLSPKSLGIGYSYVEIPTPKGMVTCEINGEKITVNTPRGVSVLIE